MGRSADNERAPALVVHMPPPHENEINPGGNFPGEPLRPAKGRCPAYLSIESNEVMTFEDGGQLAAILADRFTGAACRELSGYTT